MTTPTIQISKEVREQWHSLTVDLFDLLKKHGMRFDNQELNKGFSEWEKLVFVLLESAQERGREEGLFNRQELEIMWIDYKSLVATTKMMSRQVVGDKKLEFVLNSNDQVREEILTKLEPYKPASLKGKEDK